MKLQISVSREAPRSKYRQTGEDWYVMTDAIYPYEFSIPIDEEKGDFEFIFEVENSDQKVQKSDIITLEL